MNIIFNLLSFIAGAMSGFFITVIVISSRNIDEVNETNNNFIEANSNEKHNNENLS